MADLNELHEAIRQREALLNEASALLAAGSGEDSPEYAEFLRLRAEVTPVSRTPDLDHCAEMVRKKTKELRKWLHRMDRALGTVDPVEAILDFLRLKLKLQNPSSSPIVMGCVADIIVAIEDGDWIPKMENTDA